MAPTLKSMFEQTVAKYPEKEGLVDLRLGTRWTYREWDIEVNRLANALKASGVGKGDRVSTVLFNTAEFATSLFACMKIGAIFNPINFRLMSKELSFILKDADPKVVLFEKATSSQVQPLVQSMPHIEFWSIDEQNMEYALSYYEQIEGVSIDRPSCHLEEDDPYAIMYTSGTTGLPKGVVHSHRDMVDQALLMTAALRLTDKDRGLTVAPIFHCAELHCTFFPRVMVGAANVFMHHFDPAEVIETVKEEEVTSFFAAPTMWNMMLQEDFSKEDFRTLRQGLYGGAPMAPALTTRLHEALGVQLIQAYGMTEMGPAITALMEDEQQSKAGSAGRPLINFDVRVVKTNERGPSEPEEVCKPGEPGEIIVRGPSMMQAYYNRPEATEEALYKGWYHTGDIGSFDDDGYLWVSDRVKDMIISGGENIYSREVEDVLFDHPAVMDAAVIGEPDELWGERVVAFIVKKDDHLDEKQLDEFCTSENRLARYKRPRRYEFVSELPRNASGKLQKFKLREKSAAILE
ncbi:fatty acid--CoA ligase [Halobacillus yeomjeoni]|uniref:Fatty acid--CoA ligase n=1 Tax=Halobacillus yeomjeoni TaxID=311194 RepID=A0A931MV96_9BACI|nr:fatty acid--CoA ligase [Halobacillus yeomjeoni]MBH0230355.1 fatty acid--CoA ligase [Halobacillus yeomjeoni]MCA0984781.1 fatty acid--CoA ligase [Halobacillus yeomjeoni]